METQLTRRTRINIVLREARVSTSEPNLEGTMASVLSYLESLGYTTRQPAFWKSEANGIFIVELKLHPLKSPDCVSEPVNSTL